MNKIFILNCVLLFLTGISLGEASDWPNVNNEYNPEYSLETIIIDAGHGGKDPGAISTSNRRLYEKDVNLSVAIELAKLIEEKTNYSVYLIRDTDRYITLKERAEIANQYNANSSLFISIHCNASNNHNARGVETYIFDLEATDKMAARVAARENAGDTINVLDFILNDLHHRGNRKYSWEAAWQVQSTLVYDLNMCDRNEVGASDKCVKQAPFSVIANTNMPAILVELGFLTNKIESQKLGDFRFRQKVASSLLKAIISYGNITSSQIIRDSGTPKLTHKD